MTEFIEKAKPHGNKLVHGLSVTALIYLYSIFPSKTEFNMLRDELHELNRDYRTLESIMLKASLKSTNSFVVLKDKL